MGRSSQAMEDLFGRARIVTERALASGALGPIETRLVQIEDRGIVFDVRVIRSLEAKERAARTSPPGASPFLHPEAALRVCDVGDSHVVLLNKFPVFELHVLLVTRTLEDQRAALTERDVEALWASTEGLRALAFYNAGATAGASQPHRHLQLVPLPLSDAIEDTPIDRVVRDGALPFPHAVADTPREPSALFRTYRALLAEVGCADGEPHNVLSTPAWTMVVPRSRERFEGVSVNALGFAGSLLVKDDAQLERIRATGPATVLRAVAGRLDG